MAAPKVNRPNRQIGTAGWHWLISTEGAPHSVGNRYLSVTASYFVLLHSRFHIREIRVIRGAFAFYPGAWHCYNRLLFEGIMNLLARKWTKWKWVAVAVVAAALLWQPAKRIAFSVKVARSLQRLASGDNGANLPVKAVKVHAEDDGRHYEALAYFPRKAPARKAVILVAGLSELGCYHPRLVAFSRHLAAAGVMVVTPDIREFRDFRISAAPIAQIALWRNRISTMEGAGKVVETGVAGISYAGTLALMAAARPDLRDRISFVIAIGPYSDLTRCTREWFAAAPTAGAYYPTRFYAKWIVMRAALDMIPDPEERRHLDDVLYRLLLQKPLPPPPPSLSEVGARWRRLAVMKEDQSDPELAQAIQDRLTATIFSDLDPSDELGRIKCPVFLVHGAYDDLIPPEESAELSARISRSHLLITPFLTHTHPTDTHMSLSQKTRAIAQTIIFCYRLAGAID